VLTQNRQIPETGSGDPRLEALDDWTSERWDNAIASFGNTRFYHGSAWLGAMEKVGRGRILRFRLVQDGRVTAYFPALLVRRGPFRILGSPLSGTMTESLGPVGDSSLQIPAFLSALNHCCRARGIHYLELGSPLFDPELMQQYGYQLNEWNTLEVNLSESAERMWSDLSGKARNRIRKAERLGLITRVSTDPAFLDRHFLLVRQVFGRHRRSSPFARADLQTVCDSLGPVGQVFLIEVHRPEVPEPVASGIFPHDSGMVYSLSTASSEEGRVLCANDLMHWDLMRRAGQLGLSRYRMGDNYRIAKQSSRFKDKFGGSPVTVRRFVRHSSPLARYSSELFGAWKRLRQWFA